MRVVAIWTRVTSKVPAKGKAISYVVFGLLTSVFLIVNSLSDHRDTQPFPKGVVTTGVVQSVSGGKAPYATIEFTDLEGQRHEFDGPGETFAFVSEGDHVRVSYLPSDPAQARDLSAQTLWQVWLVVGVGLGGLSLFGAFRLIAGPRSIDIGGRSGNAPRHARVSGTVSNPSSIENERFTRVRWREGYDITEVDALLDRVSAGTATSSDVKSIRFRPVRLQPGYDMGQVDDYLASVEERLRARGN